MEVWLYAIFKKMLIQQLIVDLPDFIKSLFKGQVKVRTPVDFLNENLDVLQPCNDCRHFLKDGNPNHHLI